MARGFKFGLRIRVLTGLELRVQSSVLDVGLSLAVRG